MSKINNKNLIASLLGLFTIFAFALILIPSNAKAETCRTWWEGDNYVGSCNSGNYSNTNYNNNYNNPNPAPYINSISPNSANINSNITITVFGNGFVQSSTVRWNGYDKPTTYLDSGTLKAQLSYSDLNNGGSYPITVWNSAPGGGFSNAVMFTVKNNAVLTSNSTSKNSNSVNQNSNTSTKTTNTTTTKNTNQSDNSGSNGSQVGALAAGAIFGSNTFLPSSLLQWIFFAFLILLAVVLWRRLYVTEEEKNSPLKHS
jgi:hypothetical protein